MNRSRAAGAAALTSLAFVAWYLLFVRTAVGQAADVLAFRLAYDLVPQGWPAQLLEVFSRGAVIAALAPVVAELAGVALVRRSWRAVGVAVLVVVVSVTAGPVLRDDVLTRPRFSAEAFPENSLPSTHVIATTALVIGVLLLWPGRWPWWLPNAAAVLVVLVALGNVVGQAHRPSDVVASLLLVGAAFLFGMALLGYPPLAGTGCRSSRNG